MKILRCVKSVKILVLVIVLSELRFLEYVEGRKSHRRKSHKEKPNPSKTGDFGLDDGQLNRNCSLDHEFKMGMNWTQPSDNSTMCFEGKEKCSDVIWT